MNIIGLNIRQKVLFCEFNKNNKLQISEFIFRKNIPYFYLSMRNY